MLLPADSLSGTFVGRPALDTLADHAQRAQWSCADLHKRRKHRLAPKRIIITAASALVILIIAIGLWSYGYLLYGNFRPYVGWGPLDITDLSGLLPFFAIFDVIP